MCQKIFKLHMHHLTKLAPLLPLHQLFLFKEILLKPLLCHLDSIIINDDGGGELVQKLYLYIVISHV